MWKKKLAAIALAAMLATAPFATRTARATPQPTTEEIISRSMTAWVLGMFWIAAWDILTGQDPAIIGMSSRHDPWSQTIDGVTATPAPASRSSAISTLFWGGYDLSRDLGLPPNQRLAIGGLYRHDWSWTTISGTAEQTGDNHSLGAIAVYQLDAWHLSGAFAYDWGDAKYTSLATGGVGSFDTSGHSFGLQIGRVFTLHGDERPVRATEAGPYPLSVHRMSIHIDPAFRVGYARGRAGAFTNSVGLAFGKEIERAWTLGGTVTLSAVIPESGGTIWRPYISFSLDRQVGYRHTIDLPASGRVAHLDHDKTYWGVNGGVGVWLNRNVSLGVSGFYRGSGDQNTGGGMFWVQVNLFGPGGYLRGISGR